MTTTANPVLAKPDQEFESVVYGFRHQPISFVTQLVQQYGDLIKLPFGDRSLYFLNHPDFIRDIFIGKPGVFAKRKDMEAEHMYLTQICDFTPLFNSSEIPKYAPLMTAAAERAQARWSERYREAGPFEVDMYREMGQITLEVVFQTLFGVDVSADSKNLFDQVLTMNEGYGFNPIEATLGVFMPPLEQTPPPESLLARASIHSYVEALAEEAAAQPVAHSFLAMLVKAMGPKKATPVAMNIMFAMHEVTATTLPWSWYLLAKTPEPAALVRAELNQVLRGRAPNCADIASLPYTGMMFEEVRRLYPSVWIVGRFVREEYAFADYPIPAGSVVMASQRVMHQDARYFPEPATFDPSRWTPEARSTRPPFSYFPFSAGPRACIGEVFAKAEDVIVFGALAQNWQARLILPQQPEPIAQKSMAPTGGIRMIIEKIS